MAARSGSSIVDGVVLSCFSRQRAETPFSARAVSPSVPMVFQGIRAKPCWAISAASADSTIAARPSDSRQPMLSLRSRGLVAGCCGADYVADEHHIFYVRSAVQEAYVEAHGGDMLEVCVCWHGWQVRCGSFVSGDYPVFDFGF